MFVFSGLFPLVRTEDGLAAVLGHEIAHNLAEHVAERMSGSIGTDILLWSIILLTGGLAAVGTWALGNSALDLLFGRPMGRRQESEADYIGLMMMAEACYDPRQALGFWRRMERLHQQEEPPEWMSTHPSVRFVTFFSFFLFSFSLSTYVFSVWFYHATPVAMYAVILRDRQSRGKQHGQKPNETSTLTVVFRHCYYRIITGYRRSRNGCPRPWRRCRRAIVAELRTSQTCLGEPWIRAPLSPRVGG